MLPFLIHAFLIQWTAVNMILSIIPYIRRVVAYTAPNASKDGLRLIRTRYGDHIPEKNSPAHTLFFQYSQFHGHCHNFNVLFHFNFKYSTFCVRCGRVPYLYNHSYANTYVLFSDNCQVRSDAFYNQPFRQCSLKSGVLNNLIIPLSNYPTFRLGQKQNYNDDKSLLFKSMPLS